MAYESDRVHRYFELSYSTYLVMHRTLLQSMPDEWQNKFIDLVEEFDESFRYKNYRGSYLVRPAESTYYVELSDHAKKLNGITSSVDNLPEDISDEDWDAAHEEVLFWDADGTEHTSNERVTVLIGVDDDIPPYDRGRAYVEPRPNVDEDA